MGGRYRKLSASAARGGKTLSEAFEEFYEEKQILGRGASTLRCYEQTYRYFKKYMETYRSEEKEVLLTEVTKDEVLNWISFIEPTVTPASVKHYIRDIRSFLYWCMDKEYLECFKIQEIKAQEENPLDKMFTDEELEILTDKPREGDTFCTWRMWAMINWALAVGNRQKTICAVKVEDIDFNTKQVYLRHTKNKKYQHTALTTKLERIIKLYMNRYEISEGEYLFPSSAEDVFNDGKLTEDAMRHCFAKYCKDRGVSRTNFHGLRHNFAKLWLQSGGDIGSLQSMMGHETPAMTLRYVRYFGNDITTAAEKFSPLNNIAAQKTMKANFKKRRR